MSREVSASERSYGLLKAALLAGEMHGDRLDLARLSRMFGTSVTPVREAAMRLVGERLLGVTWEGRLQVLQLGEARLRELYALSQRLSLLGMAWQGQTRTGQRTMHLRPESDPEAMARDFFHQLANWSGCGPFVDIVDQLSDQLAPARHVEAGVIRDAPEELRRMVAVAGASAAPFARALRRYHRRRIERVPSIVWELRRGSFR